MILSSPENTATNADSDQRNPGSTVSTSIAFALILVVFISARLWRLTTSCLWFDEIFSIHAASHSWIDMLHFVAADIIHPPLFYALLKIWIGLGGESLLWLRLFPALTSIVAVVPLVLIGRELNFSTGARNLAVLLTAVNGYLIKYAQEVRMYSLLLLLSLCSFWLFLRFFRADRPVMNHVVALTLANSLLVYTHYSGWFVVLLQAFAILLWCRGKLRVFLLSAATLLIAYIPWIYELGRTSTGLRSQLAQNIGWVGRPRLSALLEFFTLLNKPFSFSQSSLDVAYDFISLALSLLIFGIPIVAFALKHIRARQESQSSYKQILGLLVFAFAPALLLFVLSWMFPHSVWGTRHLIIAAGPYSLLASQSLARLRPYWTRITLALSLACWLFLAGGIFLLRPPPQFVWCSWERLARDISNEESSLTSAVRVYAFEDLVAYHLWFSLEKPSNNRFDVMVIKGLEGIREDPAYFLPRGFSGVASGNISILSGDDIWVAFRASRWDAGDPPLNLLLSRGYRIGAVLSTKAQGQYAYLVRLERNK